MKTLKISFLQSTPDFGREGIYQLLKDRYRVVEDDSDFDYLIATPWFYVNREADGGIGATNVKDVLDAGVNVVVAGSAVFGAKDPAAAIAAMRAAE